MKRRTDARRQAGALLLTVALLLALIAALAFGLNRAAGMDAQSVGADYERRNAAYLVAGALAAATWANEINKCNTNNSVSTVSLPSGTISAAVSKSPPKSINVVATVTPVGGATVTQTRNAVNLIDLSNTETKDLGGGPRDTYITAGILGGVSLLDGMTLALASNQQHALLYWPMTDIPNNTEVLSARLALTQNGSSSVARTVNVHRMTSSWDTSATWKLSRNSLLGGTYWSSTTTALGSDGGGDYSSPVLASTKVTGAGTYYWDVTGLVDGWVSGRLVDYGMLLRLQDPNQSVSFHSLEALSNGNKPVLRVTFAKQC